MKRSRLTLITLVISLVAATIYPARPTTATQKFIRNNFRQKEVVIRLKPGVSISTITARYGISALEKDTGVEEYRLGWSAVKDVQEILSGLASDPDVDFAAPNYVVQMPEILQSTTAFVDQSTTAFVDGQSPISFFTQPQVINLGLAQAQSYTLGGGVKVAVIDTGIDPGHPLFAGRIAPNGYDFVGQDAQPNDEPGGAGYGHGTFVSGLVMLAAPNATIMPLRAFGSDGQGTSFNIARAIRYAKANGAQVINMSFGLLDQDPLISNAINEVYQTAFLVASAGNDNQNSLHSPADMGNRTTAVTSTTSNDRKAQFSNYHNNVRVAAPGVNVYSAYPGGRWATWSGTSFSTALVSGEAALLLAINPQASRVLLNQTIQQSGVNLNPLNPSYVNKLGTRINYRAAVETMILAR